MRGEGKPIDRFEVRLAGEGGQGIILAGIILAEAAALYEGKNVVQTQDYGPEARGGASKAELVIAEGPIYYPKVLQADLLLAMSQEACDKYGFDVKEDGIIVVDSSKVDRVHTSRAYQVPLTTLAVEVTGEAVTANILALGLIVGLSGVVSRESLEKAVSERVPARSRPLNLKALEAGFAEAEGLLAAQKKPAAAPRLDDWYKETSPWRLG
ncbi:MAG: 2-oxoacid:acceptor oxidoreductase family protein [Anaerolineae bacterium]